MPGESHARKSHLRRTKHGVTQVRSTLVKGLATLRKKQGVMLLRCQDCGAAIIRIKMPNNGAVCYDAVDGLRRVKHRCSTIGSGLSKRRDDLTPDLFERSNEASPSDKA